jgi:D-xylose transport system substrate-binding protein
MKLSALAAVSLAALFLLSCTPTEPDDEIVIGFSVASDDFLLERWNKDVKIFTSKAADLGAEVLLAKSPGDALSQIPQIQFLLDSGVDVIVVIPQDMELLSGVIQKAMDRGVPVLSYDRPVMGVAVSGYVSFDNRRVGRLLAGATAEEAPGGSYLVVNGSVRDNNSFEINGGMHEVLDPMIAAGEMSIVEELWLEYWSFDEALEKIEAALNGMPLSMPSSARTTSSPPPQCNCFPSGAWRAKSWLSARMPTWWPASGSSGEPS